jgi:chemotaxis signal transduction protein
VAEETNRPTDTMGETPDLGAMSGRAITIAAMERLVTRIAEGGDPAAGRSGSEYLLFTCGQTSCAVPLACLREVLPALPSPVPLPFSPPWLLGVFPLRLDVLGLVDPTPMLLGAHAPAPQIGSTATAIVAGDDTLLALAVSSVGDIALIQPEEISARRADDAPGVVATYSLGRCTPQNGGTYELVDMPRLIDDLVYALREVADNE